MFRKFSTYWFQLYFVFLCSYSFVFSISIYCALRIYLFSISNKYLVTYNDTTLRFACINAWCSFAYPRVGDDTDKDPPAIQILCVLQDGPEPCENDQGLMRRTWAL